MPDQSNLTLSMINEMERDYMEYRQRTPRELNRTRGTIERMNMPQTTVSGSQSTAYGAVSLSEAQRLVELERERQEELYRESLRQAQMLGRTFQVAVNPEAPYYVDPYQNTRERSGGVPISFSVRSVKQTKQESGFSKAMKELEHVG